MQSWNLLRSSLHTSHPAAPSSILGAPIPRFMERHCWVIGQWQLIKSDLELSISLCKSCWTSIPKLELQKALTGLTDISSFLKGLDFLNVCHLPSWYFIYWISGHISHIWMGEAIWFISHIHYNRVNNNDFFLELFIVERCSSIWNHALLHMRQTLNRWATTTIQIYFSICRSRLPSWRAPWSRTCATRRAWWSLWARRGSPMLSWRLSLRTSRPSSSTSGRNPRMRKNRFGNFFWSPIRTAWAR